MGIRDWFVNVTSQGAPLAGFYKAVDAAGRTCFFGFKCPRCAFEVKSERVIGGSFSFFHCGKTHSYPFVDLKISVTKTVPIGAPGNVLFFEDMGEESGAKGGWAIFRQPKLRP